MAKKKAPLLKCLEEAVHHIEDKDPLVIFAAVDPGEALEFRLGLVHSEIAPAIAQIQKIEALAKKKRYYDVLEILNEPIEFGYDHPAKE